jgi:hypothetical protein
LRCSLHPRVILPWPIWLGSAPLIVIVAADYVFARYLLWLLHAWTR